MDIIKFSLANLPTPLHKLNNLSKQLNANIWIKRDDLTGLAFGGNKTRKLEYLIADAQKNNAKNIITAGMSQSNHCRQTAAAARLSGLNCHLVLGLPKRDNGNLLLDNLLQAKIHWCEKHQREEYMQQLAQKLPDSYVIPYGGSNNIGAYGYATAIEELQQTTNIHFDNIILATSSGGTQAGLVYGAKLHNIKTNILGISVDCNPQQQFENAICEIARNINSLTNKNLSFSPQEFNVNYDYLGEGYAILSQAEKNAITQLAQTEAIFLDPVYTAKAFAGFLSLIKQNKLSGNLLFWHTGGTPALFAYEQEMNNIE
ncbi:D-cysteine desulfhydrase family protein [Candidatus Uabimicrobium sp. HlEnr_7]|uniref:D-cysteine desulfhydrase family protein n=1 Tax=Candidatus Uabimicrobium helgolandensis TaxID=3095367 RepID=UPI003556962F